MLISLVATTFGCANTQINPQANEPPQEEPAPIIANRPFEMDTLYSLLVAEMAGDRHRFDIMLNNYTQQAEATRDIGVVARATRLARYLNTHTAALDMALLWTELDPNNPEAHYVAAAELVNANRLLEAMPHSKFLIDKNETTGFDAIGARAQQGGDIAVTQELLVQFQQLIKQHPDHQPLHIGISLLYQHAGELEQALSHTQKAIALIPDDFQARAQETRILQQLGRADEALSKLGLLVEQNPKNKQLRLQYARNLLKTDLVTAQEQFEILLESAPDNPELNLTLALVKYERGMLEEAKTSFLQLSDHPRHSSTARFYLGRIELTRNNPSLALDQLKQVEPGVNYLPALSLICDILIGQNQTDEALSLLHSERLNTKVSDIKELQGLYLLESQILTAQGQYLEAIELLKQAINDFPEDSSLIYSRAMLFTRINEITKAEGDLKRVLNLSPNNAAALNALGYTLADRTDRLDEAYQYIQKAYSITPNDPAVLDSLGWVEFRRGNLKQALDNLRQAMKAMPDHEIAAHLGEVLWVMGETIQATEVWNNGLKLNPESTIIHNTMQRLQAHPAE